VLALVVAVAGSVVAASSGALPPGFVADTVVTGLDKPTAMAWLPDGRALVTEKAGALVLVDVAAGTSTTILDLRAQVNSYGDRGLLGLAVYPRFDEAPAVFLSYTLDPPETADAARYWDGDTAGGRSLANGGQDGRGPRVGRVARYLLDPSDYQPVAGSEQVILGQGSTWAAIPDPFASPSRPRTRWACATYAPGDRPAAGRPIRDCIPSDGTSHSVGALRFAADGALYASLGDGAGYSTVDRRALRALRVDWLAGKVLRVNPGSGEGLPGNRWWNGDPGANRSRVWNRGLRNPFRFAVDPFTDTPVIGDVGWRAFEEVNDGYRGASFGWPCQEGGLRTSDLTAGMLEGPGVIRPQPSYNTMAACRRFDAGQTPPIWTWCHDELDTRCPAGGNAAIAPVIYRGTNYPDEYRGLWFGDVMQNRLAVLVLGRERRVVPVATDVVLPVDVSVGPDGNVYYVSIAGSIHRIRYVGGENRAPTAVATASARAGTLPFTVTFDASASTDPDGGTLTYLWDFGDGSGGTGATATHTYTTGGRYRVNLAVTDTSAAVATWTTAVVAGNEAPVPRILSPAGGATVPVGTDLGLSGEATDAEDGVLQGSALRWTAVVHHGDHTHPDAYWGTGATPTPMTLTDHADHSWVELCLTAVDSAGADATTCVDVRPTEVTYTVRTRPRGLTVLYDGAQLTTPVQLRLPVGARRVIEAPRRHGTLRFQVWTDGAPRRRTVVVGPADITLVARYR
jgi:glucose/arabinose dehydrogenase